MSTLIGTFNGKYKFTIEEDAQIGVEWDVAGIRDNQRFQLTVNIDNTKGSMTISPKKDEYKRGEQVTLTIKKEIDYNIGTIYINKVDYLQKFLMGNYSYNLKMDGDKTIDVNFEKIDWEKTEIGTSQNFDKLISQGKVLVDFWADWCTPCKEIAPILEKMTTMELNFKLVKVDVDANTNLMNKYNATDLPTVVLFKDGVEVARKVGKGTLNDYRALVNKAE